MNSNSPSRGLRRTCIALALCVIGGAAQAQTTSKAFMRLETASGQPITGGSTETGFEGWIPVLSFGQDLSYEVNGLGSGPRADCFSFLKRVDQSTPLLQQAFLTGDVIPTVRLRLRESTFGGGSDKQPLRVEFTDVQLCGVETIAAPFKFKDNIVLSELVTFRFGTISWVYRTRSAAPRISSYVYDLTYGTGDAELDSDMDGLKNADDPDDDNDGIPDDAEIMQRMNPISDDSNGDGDGDGSTNYQEYLAGTLPYDSNSFFGVERITLDLSQEPATATVSFPTIGGRAYRLLASTSMESKSWMEVGRFVTEDDEAPQVTDVELGTGVAQMLDRLVFKVEVDLPPAAGE